MIAPQADNVCIVADVIVDAIILHGEICYMLVYWCIL